MPDQHPLDSEIPLTPELAARLCLEKELYQAELAKCLENFDKSDDNEYYILSKKFIKEWEHMVEVALAAKEAASQGQTLHTPAAMNADIIAEELKDFNEVILNKQAQQHSEFILVNRPVMDVFECYQGHRIPRLAYFSGVNKMVELHPLTFQFIFFSPSWLKLLRQDKDHKIPLLKSLAYKNQTVLDLLYRFIEFSKKDPRNRDAAYLNNAAAKIYAGKNFNVDEYLKTLRADENMLIYPPGDELKQSMQIGELQIPEEQPLMIIELQEERWVYCMPDSLEGSGKEDRCEYCRRKSVLNVVCKCKEMEYCSEECRQKDWRYHIRTCAIQMEEDNKDPEFILKENSKRGLVGLSNLGNTCYMNAALQCMQHTQELSQYFMDKLYMEEINEQNPIGSKGKLIKSYAKFIDTVITTESEIVTPTKLKYTIGKTKEMFSGYEQHDSQEFLLFMLDTLHEDLNRVRNKPYTNSVDSNGRPDHIVAKESWINYLKRNQSVINDLMGGQYKSEVKCPDCLNISVTFDPFLIYSVPIPTNEAKTINIYLFFANYQKETLKMTLTSKNNLASELRQDACTKGEADLDYVKFFILGFNGLCREVDDAESVDRLINEKQFNENGEERQLFGVEFLPEETINLQFKKILIFKFIAEHNVLTFKRPFPFEWNNLKGEDLYNRACQFLLNLWCKSEFSQTKEREAKLNVLKTKVKEEKMFRIFMCHGETKTIKQKIVYEKRTLVEYDANITAFLEENKFNVEFQVDFERNPHFSFNSYKSYRSGGSSEYDTSFYYGHKTGTDEKYSLEECLDEMKKAEKLVEGNQVWCSKCEDLKLAEKKMQMYRASKYLIIQLKRFKQIGYEKSKNYAQVHFPLELDLQGHIIDPCLPETYFMEESQDPTFIKPKYWKGFDDSKQTKYKLYGIVNHHGSLGGGHYTAYARHGEQWYLFDDSHVKEVQTESIVTSAAYLLFYERL